MKIERSLRQLLFSEAVRLNLVDDGDVLVRQLLRSTLRMSGLFLVLLEKMNVVLKNGKQGKKFVRS